MYVRNMIILNGMQIALYASGLSLMLTATAMDGSPFDCYNSWQRKLKSLFDVFKINRVSFINRIFILYKKQFQFCLRQFHISFYLCMHFIVFIRSYFAWYWLNTAVVRTLKGLITINGSYNSFYRISKFVLNRFPIVMSRPFTVNKWSIKCRIALWLPISIWSFTVKCNTVNTIF